MLPDLSSPVIATFWAIFLLVIGVSLWKGAEPERAGAIILIYMGFVTAIAGGVTQPVFDDLDSASLMVDSIGLIGFGWIGIQANRVWGLWAAALQLLALPQHLVRVILPDTDVSERAYFAVLASPTLMVMLVLLGGTILHMRRARKYGEYRNWICLPIEREMMARGLSNESLYLTALATAQCRGRLEWPIAMMGVIVLVYSSYALAFDAKKSSAEVLCLILMSLGVVTLGIAWWWKQREDRLSEQRLREFIERWGQVRDGPSVEDLPQAAVTH